MQVRSEFVSGQNNSCKRSVLPEFIRMVSWWLPAQLQKSSLWCVCCLSDHLAADVRAVPSLLGPLLVPAAVVLGTTPWTLGGAVSGQLCRLVLRGAGTLADLPAATLLGPYTWGKLTHLEIQGAEVRGHVAVQICCPQGIVYGLPDQRCAGCCW
jgi:hypothetical protein